MDAKRLKRLPIANLPSSGEVVVSLCEYRQHSLDLRCRRKVGRATIAKPAVSCQFMSTIIIVSHAYQSSRGRVLRFRRGEGIFSFRCALSLMSRLSCARSAPFDYEAKCLLSTKGNQEGRSTLTERLAIHGREPEPVVVVIVHDLRGKR